MRISKKIILASIASLLVASPALAEGTQTTALLSSEGLATIGIGIAVFGGAMAQAKAIVAALESISRNPGAAGQMFLPWILALVFIESLVIYALVITLKVVGII